MHSAYDWHSVLEPVVARYHDANIRRYFRGNAAVADPDLYTFLEEKGYLYATRLPGNQNVEHLLTRPLGRPFVTPAQAAANCDALRLNTRTGRPLGTDSFLSKIEVLLGRRVRALPVGRPKRAAEEEELK